MEEGEEDGEETQVERRDSLDDADERNETERELCKHIKANEKQEIKKIISKNRDDIDVNRKNLEDHDILTLAVMTKDVETVNMILDINPDKVDIKPGLLEAAKQGMVKMVLAFFFFADKQKFDGHKWQAIVVGAQQMHGNKPKVVTSDSIVKGEFTPDQTPLMMAAVGGHYDVIKLLYDRGERLPALHFPSCACSVCRSESRDLERTLNRLHLLKAMTSPQYLIFMGEQDGDLDPVLESFNRIKDVQQCRKEEPEYKEEYDKILEKIEKFPVDLINLCRTTEETKIFLGQKEGYVGPASMQYPRLGLAIEHSHKEFVISPNIQFFMHNEWIGYGWNPKEASGKILKFLVILFLIVGFPIVQLILWFGLFCCSQSAPMKFLLSPINRCWCKFGSYCTFIVLLIIMNSEERPEADIEPPTLYIRWVILVYVAGHLVSLIQQFLINPPGFFKRGWNIVDVFIQATFWASFCIWAYLFIRKSHLGFEETISRRALHCYDPLLIGDGLFAIASTSATVRLLRWYIIPKHTGPIQSVFNRLGQNYHTLLVFFGWTFWTFSVSTKILFRPYIAKKEEESLSTLEELKNVFATFFGTDELDPDKFKLETPSAKYVNPDGVETVTENPPETNLIFIKLMAIIYNVIAIGFIQNYATGVFTSDTESFLKARYIDWKYLRLQEWLYHMQDTIFTPPFNLIPNAACIFSVFSWISALACGGKGDKREAGCNFHQCCFLKDVESGEVGDARKKYPFLLKTLFQRYLQMTINEAEDEKPIKSNVSGIIEAVKELRELSKEVLGIPESGAEDMSTLSIKVPSSEKRPSIKTVFTTETTATSSMMPPLTARTTTATTKPDPSVQFVKSPKS